MNKYFAIAEVKALDDGSPYGSFEAVLSAPVEDRDNEIIDGKAFDPLPASIPILADHDGQVRSLVARAEPFYDGDQLKARGKFASHEFAQYVRSLLTEGILDTMSVGFMNPQRAMVAGKAHITKGELLESSFVVIPSNRDALVSTAKSMTDKVYVNVGPPTGSYEDVMESIRSGISQLQANDWCFVMLLATYADRVVYQVEDLYEGTVTNFECTYELTDDNAVTLGAPVEVTIEQVISPKTLFNLAQREQRSVTSASREHFEAIKRLASDDKSHDNAVIEHELEMSKQLAELLDAELDD